MKVVQSTEPPRQAAPSTTLMMVPSGGRRRASPFETPGSLEGQALWLGMLDHASGLPGESLVRRIIRISFGFKKPTLLANARLESIRSTVLALRIGGRRRLRKIVSDALANGVTSSEMLWLTRNVAPKRWNDLRDLLARRTDVAATPRTAPALRRAPVRVSTSERSQPAFAA